MNEQNKCHEPEIGRLLAAYEMGVLEQEEHRRFETHLADCPACLETLYENAPASELLRAEPARCRKALQRRPRTVRRPGFFENLAAALGSLLKPRVLVPIASVAVLTVVFLNYDPAGGPNIRSLANIEAVPWTTIEVRGTDDGPCDLLFARGMEHYVAERYDSAAIDLFSARSHAADNSDWSDRYQAAFYNGLSLLLADLPADSIDPLTEAAASPLLPIAERSRWYLAQAHLLMNDSEAATAQLNSLLESPVYGQTAATQLQKLGRICNNNGSD